MEVAQNIIPISQLINPHEKQKEFIAAVNKYKYVLYGGAKGGGKSYILRWILVYMLMKYAAAGYKNVSVGLFCEDYPSLKDRQVSKIKTEFPPWLGTLGSSDVYGLSFRLKEEFGSGIICLRNLDVPEKYASSEFAVIAVDEITKNKIDVFETLRSICRFKGIDNTKMLFGGNPGGVGHNWVKKYFIKRDYPEYEKESDQFGFVSASVYDNPYQKESYIRQLESLPFEKRNAFLMGNWDTFQDIFFDTWDNKIHIIDNYPDNFEINKMATGIDYGTTTVFENIIKYRDRVLLEKENDRYTFVDKFILNDELFMYGKTKTEKVVDGSEWLISNGYNEWDIIGDSNMFYGSKEHDEYITPANAFKNNNPPITVKKIIKAKSDNKLFRVNCNDMFKDLLNPENPRFFVNRKCTNFIDCIPEIQRSKNSVDDFNSDLDNDHCFDAVKMALIDMIRKSVSKEEIKQKINSIQKMNRERIL